MNFNPKPAKQAQEVIFIKNSKTISSSMKQINCTSYKTFKTYYLDLNCPHFSNESCNLSLNTLNYFYQN